MKRQQKNQYMKEAAEYSGANCAYIHGQVYNGRAEQIISGDIHAMLYGVMAIVSRIAVLTGEPFDNILGALHSIDRIGSYEGYLSALGLETDRKETMIEGEDWQKEFEEQAKLEAQKAANIEVAKLKVELKNADAEKLNMAKQLAMIRREAEYKQKHADEQIQKLTKECQALESRMKEMEKVIVRVGD